MALLPFVVGSTIARGLRFFLVAGLMYWGGERLEKQLLAWIDRIGYAVIALLIAGYFIYA